MARKCDKPMVRMERRRRDQIDSTWPVADSMARTHVNAVTLTNPGKGSNPNEREKEAEQHNGGR